MQTIQKQGREYIFDPIRKKYLVLTPEEWVRQQVLDYMMQVKAYPASLISVEKRLRVGSTWKRYDILVYRHSKPWLVVECKEEREPLGDAALRQLLAYNSQLKTNYLVITNGKSLHCYEVASAQWSHSFPDYTANPAGESNPSEL